MDVAVPEIPARYEPFREALRAFIAESKPDLDLGKKAGMRVPERAEDVATLRRWVRALDEAGFSPSRHAAKRLDAFETRIAHQELRATEIPYVLGNPLVQGAIARFGSELQKETYLPSIVNGDHIWTQLFSEPDAGSDLASLQTRADVDGDYFVVSGQKVWSTWAQYSDYGYLLARTTPGRTRQGITAFILDMKSPGVTTSPLREITGSADFNEVFLDGVRIPSENVIGEVDDGWKVSTASLADERGGVGGGGRDPVADLIQLVRGCRRAGRPAEQSDAVRQDVARLAARSRVHRYLGYRSATKAEHGKSDAWDGPVNKILFSELHLAMADYAMELQGPRGGLVDGDPLAWDDGRWQDAFLYSRAWTIGGGTNEILRNLIAERGLGLPREPRG